MSPTVDYKLQECLAQLNEAEKTSVLQMLETFIQGRKQASGRISIEDYNREIDEALAEAEKGEYISQEEMENRAAKW